MLDDTLSWAHFVADGKPGGGTTMILGLIDELRQRGAAPPTLISQPGSYLEQQAATRGLPFVGVELFRWGWSPSLPSQVASALEGRKFALTHVHGLRAAHQAVSAPLRSLLGCVVYTVHGLHQLHMPWPLRLLANVAERRAMQRVNAALFVSHADEGLARQHRLLAAPQQVIYNGISLGELQPMPPAERDIDVAFIGRLVPQKNPERAALALVALAARGWRCVLAGGGPLQAQVHAILATVNPRSPIRCMGELDHAKTLALLARTRVLLMPSRWEGLPILPMEAGALGVPVVATAVQGMDEVVLDQHTGYLIPDDRDGTELANARTLADAAQHLLSDFETWNAMSEAGPRRARRLFDRRACAAAYAAVYERVLESTRTVR